jgi:hypothetical protein
MGALLKNVWHHVEALQTTDLDAFTIHIADVFENALINSQYIEVIFIHSFNYLIITSSILFHHLL